MQRFQSNAHLNPNDRSENGAARTNPELISKNAPQPNSLSLSSPNVVVTT